MDTCWKCPYIGGLRYDQSSVNCWCLFHDMVKDPNLECFEYEEKVEEAI